MHAILDVAAFSIGPVVTGGGIRNGMTARMLGWGGPFAFERPADAGGNL